MLRADTFADKRFYFKKENRILQAAFFAEMFKTSKKRNFGFFSFYLKFNSNTVAKLGICIAKKNLKSAVLRNKYKRLIRESFRNKQHQLFGVSILVVIHKSVTEYSLQEFRKILQSSFDKEVKK